MQIFVNNQLAALKAGDSFEFVSENRSFSGADSYSLTISFPLKDCPQNIAIFGKIHRPDVLARNLIFDCEIRDGAFCKSGALTITEVNESEVKTQFLEGRSRLNFFKAIDEIYINELDLGRPEIIDKSLVSPAQAWTVDRVNPTYVALPWVNNASGHIQNKVVYKADKGTDDITAYRWHDSESGAISWQPFLIYITQLIIEKAGFSADLSAWHNSSAHRYFLVCNCLPRAWDIPEFARALPH